MSRLSPRPSVLALLLASSVATNASALVDGDRHQLWKKHTVQGGSITIGNTLLASTSAGVINDIPLQPSETFATITGLPSDAAVVAAYAIWAGSLRLGETADQLVDMQFPDGSIQPNIPVDRCRTLGRSEGGISSAYACRADVTSLLRSHLARMPDGTTTPNGTYNLLNVHAAPGTPMGTSGSCSDPNDPCQSAFGGWALVLVWSSPSASTTKEVMIYDGFLRMDEICDPSFGPGGGCINGGSSGVSAPITLAGFNAISRDAELSFLAFEGDRQLGSPPEPAQNADFMRFNGVELSNNALGVLPKNLFNSVIFNRQGGTPFSGVDIKTLPVRLPVASGFPPTTRQVDIQPGSGDGIPDPGPFFQSQGFISNGELFYLGAVTLTVEALAPNFRNSRKVVDKTNAAPNDVLTYSIHVENNGTYLADASLRDVLPADLLYVPGSTKVDGTSVPDGAGGTNPLHSGLSLGQLWPLGAPGVKNYVDVTFQARIRPDFAGGTLCNTGEVNASYSPPGGSTITLPPVPVKTNPCTLVQIPRLGQPLKTVLVDGQSTRDAKPGSRLRYTITLSNTGSQAATALTLTDDLPAFLHNLDVVTVPFGAVDQSSPTGGANGTGQVRITNLTIPAQFSVSVIFDADVLDDQAFVDAGGADGQAIPNQARLAGVGVEPARALSDDPTSPLPGDPTTVFVRFGVDLSTSAKTVQGDTNGEVAPGQQLTYTVRVTNTGARDGTATIDDPMPSGLTGCTVVSGPIASCANGRLQGQFPVAAGQSVDLTFRSTVNASAADGTLITNVANVGALERPNVLWELRSPTVRVRSQVLWSFTKAVSDVNGGGIEPGDELLYSLVLRNVGNRPSTAVSITDPLDANLTFLSADSGGTFSGGQVQWALPALAAGAEARVSFRARINNGVPNGTTIANQAVARSAEATRSSDDPATAAADDPTLVRVVAAPSFVDSTKAVRDVNGGVVQPGDLLEYTLVVRNTGRAVGTKVVVTDVVDDNLEIDTVLGGGVVSGRTITWNLGTLQSGQQAPDLVFTARVRTPLANDTLIENQARIQSAETPSAVPTDDPATPALDDPTSVRVASTVTLSQSTKTVVDDDGGEPLPGDALTWTIRVTATGDAPASNVTVLDTIERCLVDIVPGRGGQFDGARIRWDASTTPALARVLPGQPVDLTFTARIALGTPDGTACRNQAALLSPSTPAPTLTDDPSTAAANDPTTIVVVSKPLLTASVKTVELINDAAGDGRYNPGDRVRWTIVVRNTGSESAQSVNVSDVLPAFVEDVTLSSGGIMGPTTATWAVGNIPSRSERELSIEATIVKPLDDGTIIDNQASITALNVIGTALTDDPTTPAEDDPTRFIVESAPQFRLEKTVTDVNGGRVEPTDVLRYSLTLRNEGTSLARNVRLSDPLDANLTFLSASAGGAYDAATRTVRWNLGTLDLTTVEIVTFEARIAAGLDNGTAIDNQAQVTSDEVAQPTLSDDPSTAAPLDPTRVLVISAADLSASTKTWQDRNGGDPRPNDLIDWTITVTNTGNALGRDLRIEDTIDARLLVEGSIGQGGVQTGDVITWTPPAPLGIGESATFTYTTRIRLPQADGTVISNQAFMTVAGLVTPFATDDPTTPEAGDPTSFVVRSSPTLSVKKRVTDINGGDVRPGDELGYTMTLRNIGDADATGGVLTDVLDPNVDFVSATGDYAFDATTRTVRWNVPRVGVVPEELLINLVTRVRRPLANGTIIDNQASLTVAELGAPELSDDPFTTAPRDPTRVTVVARPDFSTSLKTVTDLNGGDFAPEDEVEFAIVVKNTGDVASTTTTVTDDIDSRFTDVVALDGGTFAQATRTLTWSVPIVALSPAGDRTVRFRAKVAPLLANGTRLENQAFIADPALAEPTPTDDPSTATQDDPTGFTVVSAPQLQLSSKTVTDVDGGLVRPGDTLRYDIVVKNVGNTYATDVTVDDPIDPLLENLVASQGGAVEAGRILWNKTTTPALAQVAPGADVALSFTARIVADAKSGDVVTNQALVASAEGVQSPTDDPSTPEAGDATLIELRFPDLSSTLKSVLDVNGGDVEPGDELIWTIAVRNDGTLPATGVSVEDVFDTENLVDVAVRDGGLLENGVVRWNPTTTPALAQLEPGATVELSISSRVKPLTRNATVIENQATVRAVELLAPVLTDADLTTPEREKTTVTVVATPRMETSTLAVHDPSGEEVRPGDLLEYTLTVRNTGNTWATNVRVNLPLPAELEDVTLSGPGTLADNRIRWATGEVPEFASMLPESEVVLRFTARVRSPMANGTILSLQAQITVTELSGPTPTDDPATPVVGDPTIVRVFSAPRFINSEKSVTDLNGAPVQPGDELLYELVIINDGTEPGRNVRLADVVPAGTTYVKGSLTLNGARVDDGVEFPLTRGLSLQSAREGTAPGEILVDDGVFPDDEAAVVRFRVIVSRQALAGTVLRNQGTVTSETTQPQLTDDPSTPLSGDATVVVVGGGPAVDGARLSWKLVEDRGRPEEVNPGDVVEVTVEVPNAGDAPISCLVSELPLDPRLSPEGDLTLNGSTVTAVEDDDAGEWTFDTPARAVVRLEEIPARGLARVTLRARVAEDASGIATLQARVACAGVLERYTDSDPSLPGAQPARVRIGREGVEPAPNLQASLKTVEDLNGGEVMPGDVLRYRITLVNEGDGDAVDVAITDVLPSGLSYVTNSASGDPGLLVEGVREADLSSVTARAARLGPGERLTATFRAQLRQGLPNGRVVTNIASVRAQNVEAFQLPPATVTVGGIAGTAAVVGRLWEDLDGDGAWSASADEAYAGFQLRLMSAAASPDDAPVAIKSVLADSRGDFSLVNLPVGRYSLEARSPDGAVWKRIELDALAPSETRLVDVRLVPTGLVYGAKDGKGVAGARVVVTYDDSMVGQTPPACDEDQRVVALETDPLLGIETPRRVSETCLLPGQQGQLVAPNGGYRFDLPQTPEPVPYRLWVAPVSHALSFPSIALPAQPGFAPAGAVDGPRPVGGKGTWYSALRFGAAGDETTYNHLPVDALQDQLRIVKSASRGSVRLGEFVTYTVALVNNSARDITVAESGGVQVVDTFPEHLRYVKGSARALRRTRTGDQCARVDGTTEDAKCAEGSVEPQGVTEGSGRLARFGAYDLRSGETLIVRYTLTVTSQAKPGDYDNVAHAETAGVRITQDATATVRVLWDALFNESTVIGKVFCDDDGNGIQTPGEAGLGLARIYSDNGYYVEADYDGKYHFVGLKPGLHLFKLDERSLPPGTVTGEDLRKTMYLTSGLDARLNFAVKCDLDEARPDLVRLLRDPPPPPPPPPPAVIVSGNTMPLELTIDGVTARPSRTSVTLVLDDEAQTRTANVPVGVDGTLESPLNFRVLRAAGPAATAWTLTISDETGAKLHELSNTGDVPETLIWNGKDGAGQWVVKQGGRYLYTLRLAGPGGVDFITPTRAFGIDWFDPAEGRPLALQEPPFEETLTGELFGARDAKPRPALIGGLARIVSRLPKGEGRISIEVHADPSDGRRAQVLTEERAGVVAELLAAQGVAPQRLEAAGLGATRPMQEAPKAEKGKRVDRQAVAAAQAANRRVVITAQPEKTKEPLPSVPQPEPALASVTAGETSVEVGPDGRFRQEIPRPESGGFFVRAVDAEGAVVEAKWAPGPRVPAFGTPPLQVRVDTRTGRTSIGSADFALPLLAAQVELANGGIVQLADTGPAEPLRFVARIPARLDAWQLTVRDPDDAVVRQLSGEGAPPPVIEWDGRSHAGAPLLKTGTYTYQFIGTDASGNRFESARTHALMFRPETPVERVFEESTLFRARTSSQLKPTARRELEQMAKRLLTVESSVVVSGHVDVEDEADVKLAAERATIVREMLVSLGVPSERIRAVGRGASEPIAPNVTKRGRDRNRRVDVRTSVKLPLLNQPAQTLAVRVLGKLLEAEDDGVFTTTLYELPTGPIDVEQVGSNGRLVKYRVEPPTPALHEDRAGTSRAPRTGASFAQAGDELPLLPFDDLPLPDEPADEQTTPVAEAAPVATVQDLSLDTPATATAVDAAPVEAVAAAPEKVEPEKVGDRILVVLPVDDAPPETVALKLIASLPRNAASLRSTRLLVRGTTDTRNELTLNGQKLEVDRNGRFARVLDLPVGEAKVELQTKDPEGNVATLTRTYNVTTGGLFVMAMADANAGTFGGEPEGIDSLALKLGGRRQAFIGGRVAATVSGETAPPGWMSGFVDKLKLTANVDTARRHEDGGFRDLYDPTRYYPIFGDGSTLVQEAPARGPVFARVDADDSHAMFGEFQTKLGASDLLRYDRTLYGGDLLFKRDWNDKVSSQVQAIGAPGDDRVRHGHAELRATGGSVYYLPTGNVIEGTERVRLVVRDRDTGMELTTSERARHTDYFVSYVEGRVLFKQPVASVAEPMFLVNNNLSTAMNGHPVFVVVDYEYRDVKGDQGGVVGAHTMQTFLGGLVSVGGGFLQESRGGASPYRLWGVELGTKKSERTFAKVEFARSNGTDANSFFSPDGGLSYAPLAGRCLSQTDPACSNTNGNALKLEAVGELAELLGREGELAQARGYLQKYDTGYFTNGSLLEQGTMKYGGQVKVPLTPKDSLLIRHDSVESIVDRDIAVAGLQPKTIIRRLTGAQYRRTEKTWGAVAEYANAITTDTSMPEGARTIVGDTLLAGGNWKPIEDLNLTLTQEGILRGDPRLLQSWQDHLTTSVGAQYRLSEKLTATLTESVRWSGENATQLGLSSQITETSQVYVNERFTSRAGQTLSTTLVGGSAQLTEGLKAYGEWQLDDAMAGMQNRAVVGLNNRWKLSEGLSLSAGYERTQVVGDAVAALTGGGALGAAPGATQGSVLGTPPFATPGLNPGVAIMPGAASRDVASVGVEWTRLDYLKASARFEGRYDNADPEFAKTTHGVADRLQLVFLSTVDWKWTDDVAFLSRIVYADAFVQDPKNPILAMRDKSSLDARYLEAIAGFAFRPKQYDWVAVLARAGRVIDRRPIDVAMALYDEQRSDLVAVAPSFETPFKVGLAFKVAYKHVNSIVTDVPESTSHVVLSVNRIDYHLLPQLDLTAEYRFLWTRVASDGVNVDTPGFVPQGELRHGAVFEVAWRPSQYFRLGGGYSFADFSDNELSRLDDFKGGFFVRATGQY